MLAADFTVQLRCRRLLLELSFLVAVLTEFWNSLGRCRVDFRESEGAKFLDPEIAPFALLPFV